MVIFFMNWGKVSLELLSTKENNDLHCSIPPLSDIFQEYEETVRNTLDFEGTWICGKKE